MKVGDLFFVYGTLRRGQRADVTHWRPTNGEPGAEFVGTAEIYGKMWNIGSFPGVTITEGFEGPEDIVHGEIFRLLDPRLAEGLDRYEGYPSLYDRVQVQTKEGLTVWVYTYNPSIAGKQRVFSGDWVEFRASITPPSPVDVSRLRGELMA